jgi:hypothetical protein
LITILVETTADSFGVDTGVALDEPFGESSSCFKFVDDELLEECLDDDEDDELVLFESFVGSFPDPDSLVDDDSLVSLDLDDDDDDDDDDTVWVSFVEPVVLELVGLETSVLDCLVEREDDLFALLGCLNFEEELSGCELDDLF